MDGVPNPDELSVRGWQRAGALVRLFAPLDGVTGAGIRTPDFLFAQGLTQHARSVRAPHTLGPLAALLGKAISTEFFKGQEEQLAGALRALTGPVLVAWEHRAICVLANFLMGDDLHTPQTWPDDCFDVVWCSSRTMAVHGASAKCLSGCSRATIPSPFNRGQRCPSSAVASTRAFGRIGGYAGVSDRRFDDRFERSADVAFEFGRESA